MCHIRLDEMCHMTLDEITETLTGEYVCKIVIIQHNEQMRYESLKIQ